MMILIRPGLQSVCLIHTRTDVHTRYGEENGFNRFKMVKMLRPHPLRLLSIYEYATNDGQYAQLGKDVQHHMHVRTIHWMHSRLRHKEVGLGQGQCGGGGGRVCLHAKLLSSVYSESDLHSLTRGEYLRHSSSWLWSVAAREAGKGKEGLAKSAFVAPVVPVSVLGVPFPMKWPHWWRKMGFGYINVYRDLGEYVSEPGKVFPCFGMAPQVRVRDSHSSVWPLGWSITHKRGIL